MAGDPDDGKPEDVSVLGHDGARHNTRMDGTTLCRMGRAQPLSYDTSPVGCMFCIDLVTAGYRATQRRGGPLP